MDYKRMSKYFAKLDRRPLIIGIIVTVIGFIFLRYFWKLAVIGFVIMVVGLLVSMSIFTGRVKGAELDAIAQKAIDDTTDIMYSRTEIDMKYVKMYHPIISGGYVFDGDVIIKEDTDGTTRSNKYKLCGLMFTETKVFIYEKAFAYNYDESSEVLNTYKYDDIDSAVIEEKQTNGGEFAGNKEITYYNMIIKLADGSSITVPVTNDATTDETIKVLNRRFDSKKAAKE